MKRNIKSLIGFAMRATNGEIGIVKDFYFDDDSWVVRYLIVETGSWLNGRKVLISTDAYLSPDWENHAFPINLSKAQIKSSPDIDTELPVYRQQEIKLYDHYLLGNYWRGGFVAGGMPLPMTDAMMLNDDKISEKITDDDLHLRSIEKVAGYNVKATDGTIGTVKDFIIDDASWSIISLVVETGYWFSGKSVLLSPETIKEILWPVAEIVVDISVAEVKECPEYDKSELWAL